MSNCRATCQYLSAEFALYSKSIILTVGFEKKRRANLQDRNSLGFQIERFIEAKLNPQTRTWYAKYLRPMTAALGADTPLTAIDRVDADRYWKSLAARKDAWASHPSRPKQTRTLSPTSMHNALRAIRTFWREMMRQRLVDFNPFDHLRAARDKRPVQMKAITPEDLNAIWQAALRSGSRDFAIVSVLATAGLRAGELISMSIQRLELDKGFAWVNGKRGWRKAYLGEANAKAIRAYLHERPLVAEDAVWLNRRGNPLGADGIRYIIGGLAAKAGVRGRHNLRAFRHRAAQSWLDSGVNAEIVSQALGHADVNVTLLIYGNQDERRVQHAMRQVEMSPFIDVESLRDVDGAGPSLDNLLPSPFPESHRRA